MAKFQYPIGDSQKRLPQIWLMSDERMGDRLLPSVKALPRGSGVIFRHYSLASEARRALFSRLRRIGRQRGLTLILAGSQAQAREWGADGYHGRSKRTGAVAPRLLHTAPLHNRQEIRTHSSQADLVFLSPLFATSSHPEGKPLGVHAFSALTRICDAPVIALGGMSRARFAMLRKGQIHGWAAISALQK